MANITLSQQATIYNLDQNSYQLNLVISASDGMPAKVFVMQQLINTVKFAAIATPVQLEEIAEDVPNAGSSYFRADNVQLVGASLEWIEWVFTEIKNDIYKLVKDYNALQNVSSPSTVVITVDGITNV